MPRSLYAASLEWQEGCQQIQGNAQALLVFATAGQPMLSALGTAQPAEGRFIVTTNPFPVDTLKTAQMQVPVLALPESGTLIFLGIGLAGLASLIRRKK